MSPHRELAQEAWDEYFDSLSKELLNAPVTIEVTSPSRAHGVEARRLALQALSYDRRSDVFEVAAARGGPRLPSSLRHLVDHPGQDRRSEPGERQAHRDHGCVWQRDG